jgi:hypothetical protein
MIVICTSCYADIEEERLEALPDTTVCSCCAQKGIGQKPTAKGVMVFGHKTAGAIQILSQETFKEWKKYNPYGRYTGRGSGVHRMMSSSER